MRSSLSLLLIVLLLTGCDLPEGGISFPAPKLGNLSPGSFSFSLNVNQTETRSFSFENTGNANLTYSISESDAALELSGSTSGTLAPQGRFEGSLSVTCLAVGDRDLTVNIASNDVNLSIDVSLNCTPRTFVLTALALGSGSGTITSNPAGIACGESCTTSLSEGSLISLSASAAPGSVFVGFSGDCEDLACDLLMDADKTVNATFATSAPDISDLSPNPLNLAAAIGDTALATVSFQNVGTAILEVNIEEVADWLDILPATASVGSGDSQDLDISASCPSSAGLLETTVAINSNDPDEPLLSLQVQLDCFSRQFSLSLTTLGPGEGSVSSTPEAISCTESCVANFDEGTVVSLAALAAEGSVFAGFSGDCQGPSCTLTMTEDKQVTASFELQLLEPNISAVTPDPLQLKTLVTSTITDRVSFRNLGNAQLTFTITGLPSWLSLTPVSGSVAPNGTRQLNFTANCPNNPGNLQETITLNSNDPDQPQTSFVVKLECLPRQFNLTLSKVGLGAGTVRSTPAAIDCGVNCNVSFSEGTVVSLEAFAAEGSVFAGFSGGPCQGMSCSLTIRSNQTISARFDRANSEPNISNPNPNPVRLSTNISNAISSQVSFQNVGDAPLSFTIGTLPGWLSLTPLSNTVAPGGNQQLNLTARCPDGPGTLQETISLNSNDPDQPQTSFVVKLECSINQFNLVVNRAGSGSGTVTSTPAVINCGNSCDASFTQGDSVTLSATANPGSEFSGFSGACQGTSCNLTMNNNLTVTANFNTINGSDFDIDLRFVDNNMSASQQAIFEQAASRWEAIITGDLSDRTVNVPAGSCSGVDFSGLVDDLVIDVKASTFDGVGGLLGRAGPCGLRGNLLPFFGVMEFDQADLAALEASGQLEEVILHEMGHVLGLGTLWGPGLFNLLSFNGADCLSSSAVGFTGIKSNQEFVILGGSGTIPVEDDGGAGTKCSHWDEQTFGNALMTGFLNGGVANPLTRLSIAALEDISYAVNYAAADPFVLSSISPSLLEDRLDYREILLEPQIILSEPSE